MQIVEYNDSYKNQLFEFLIKEAKSNELAKINMWQENWQDYPNSLPYKLLTEKLFNSPKGVLLLALESDNIVACSGAYISNFNQHLLIAGTRTWITKEHRNKHLTRELFLPAQKQWAIINGMRAIALTFNEYNSNLIQAFNRKRLGENRTKREPHHMFYNGVIEVPFPVTIQHTKQYVIYEEITEWDFDWESIRFVDNNPT